MELLFQEMPGGQSIDRPSRKFLAMGRNSVPQVYEVRRCRNDCPVLVFQVRSRSRKSPLHSSVLEIADVKVAIAITIVT